jgi:hypothetical protein
MYQPLVDQTPGDGATLVFVQGKHASSARVSRDGITTGPWEAFEIRESKGL